MTKQQFQDLYGKSIYQVRLEIAIQMWCRGKENFDGCIELADSFTDGLLREDLAELKEFYD